MDARRYIGLLICVLALGSNLVQSQSRGSRRVSFHQPTQRGSQPSFHQVSNTFTRRFVSGSSQRSHGAGRRIQQVPRRSTSSQTHTVSFPRQQQQQQQQQQQPGRFINMAAPQQIQLQPLPQQAQPQFIQQHQQPVAFQQTHSQQPIIIQAPAQSLVQPAQLSLPAGSFVQPAQTIIQSPALHRQVQQAPVMRAPMMQAPMMQAPVMRAPVAPIAQQPIQYQPPPAPAAPAAPVAQPAPPPAQPAPALPGLSSLMNPMMGMMGMQSSMMNPLGYPMTFDTMEDIFFDPDRPDFRGPMMPGMGMGLGAAGAMGAASRRVRSSATAPASRPAAAPRTAATAPTSSASGIDPAMLSSALQKALTRVQNQNSRTSAAG